MLLQTIILTVLAFLVAKVHCDCSFIHPDPATDGSDTDHDPIYGLGDQLEIKWNWDMDAGDLIIFQDYPGLKTGTNVFKQLDMGTTSTSYTWTIDLSFLIARPGSGETPQFHLELLVKGKGDVVCSSRTFAIFVPDDPKAKESIDTSVHYVGSIATGTTSSVQKPITTTNTSDKETKKPTQTSDNNGKGDSGSSSSNKGLIALGAILGVVVVGAAGVAAYFLLRRRRLQKSSAAGAGVVSGGGAYEFVPGPTEANSDSMMEPYERFKSELPGSEVQKTQYQGPTLTEHCRPH